MTGKKKMTEVIKIDDDKKEFRLSNKQKDCITMLMKGNFKRINILEGSVRSGKTYVSLFLWRLYVNMFPKGSTFLMAGKTLGALKRNVLEPFGDLFGSRSPAGDRSPAGNDNFNYSLHKKEADICGRKIYLEGASDSRSENKIRGLTLCGAYCDELSLFNEDFFIMLLSRLSVKNAKLIATTNPDNPAHWLKRKYLDNKKLDLLDFRFTIDDNFSLEKDYVDNLKKEYKGVYYQRFILGKWAAAEGRVYEHFNRKGSVLSLKEINKRCGKFSPVVIGVDYGGNKSASVFTLVGFSEGFKEVYILDEYYDKKNLSAEHLIESFRVWVLNHRDVYPNLNIAYCDSAEQLLIKSFRACGVIDIRNALKKPINSRISAVNRLISSQRLFINNKCEHLICALESAVWDSSKSFDSRLDDGTSNIDSLDAFEYALERYERELFRL